MDQEPPEKTIPAHYRAEVKKVKKLLVILTIIIFSFSMISFASADRYKKGKKGNRDRYQHQTRDNRDRHPAGWNPYYHRNKRSHGRHHYEPYYRGHWKTRHKWERHHRRYPHRYRGGKYYRDKRGHLMFSFCEREGICFSFSIGQ